MTRCAPRSARSSSAVFEYERLATDFESSFHSAYESTSFMRYGPTSAQPVSWSSLTKTVMGTPTGGIMHCPGSWPAARAASA